MTKKHFVLRSHARYGMPPCSVCGRGGGGGGVGAGDKNHNNYAYVL